ncbi:hypothetical protein D3C80_2051590 [compost metagenome]
MVIENRLVGQQFLDAAGQGEDEVGAGDHLQCGAVAIGASGNLALMRLLRQPTVHHVGR